MQTQKAEKTQLIPLSLIHPDDEQPRETFDEEKLAELVDSVSKVGILNDLEVKPHPLKKKHYVIVTGERRFIAAGRAGLKEVPCKVRELDDVVTLEHQLRENIDRHDMNALEEGFGLGRYQALTGLSVEELAAQFKRSPQRIAQRIRLTTLIPDAQKAFLKNRLSIGGAMAVSRVPAVLQAKLLGEVLSENGTLPVRDIEEHINQRYRLKLVDAPFDKTDTTLFPGTCHGCEKRTINDLNLFADIGKEDLCIDPQCFDLKLNVWWERYCAAAEKAGKRVLDDGEALKHIHYGQVDQKSKYVDLEARCYDDPKQRTWRAVLGSKFDRVILARVGVKIFQLADRKDLPEFTKEAAPEVNKKQKEKAKEDTKAKELRAAAALAKKTAALGLVHVVSEVGDANGVKPGDLVDLQLMGIARAVGNDTLRAVCKRRELEIEPGSYTGPLDAIRAHAKKLKVDSERAALALELAITQGMQHNPEDPLLIEALKLLGEKLSTFEKAAKESVS